MSSDSSHDLMTAQEVADHLRVSVVSVYRWSNATPPVLGSVRIGGVRRFRRADVERLLDRTPEAS